MPRHNRTQFCPTCQRETEHVSENSQAFGVALFTLSIVSCGLLIPIILPLTILNVLDLLPFKSHLSGLSHRPLMLFTRSFLPFTSKDV